MSSHLLHFTLVRMFALGQVYLNFISALYPLEALFSSDKVPLGERKGLVLPPAGGEAIRLPW